MHIISPIKWIDITSKIQSGKKDLLKYPEIRKYLKADDFENIAQNNGFSLDKIYINIIPLILMAGRKLVELCRQYIPQKTKSQEYNFFIQHFDNYATDMILASKYPYDKSNFKNDIDNIINNFENINTILFGDKNNPYLEEIRYLSK